MSARPCAGLAGVLILPTSTDCQSGVNRAVLREAGSVARDRKGGAPSAFLAYARRTGDGVPGSGAHRTFVRSAANVHEGPDRRGMWSVPTPAITRCTWGRPGGRPHAGL